MPYEIEVTKRFERDFNKLDRQARFVCKEEGSALYVIRCFATHKEYERWYGSFR